MPDLLHFRWHYPWLLMFYVLWSSAASAQRAKLSPEVLDSLQAVLHEVYNDDQDIRMFLHFASRHNVAIDADRRQGLVDSIGYYDSLNLIKVKKLLTVYGWLSEQQVGYKANIALFSVIQHAPYAEQKAFATVMDKAVKDGALKPSHYALYHDRMLLQSGQKQRYGSQIGFDHETGRSYVMPLEDPDGVDKRRKAVGLGPLSYYVKQWGFTWDPDEYKKKEYPNLLKDRK